MGRRVLTGINEALAVVGGFTAVGDSLEASYSLRTMHKR
jgi:hypothetical protein